jgi:chaperonin cofactor prefoldin
MAGRPRQERIGSALHALASDLVTERRRVVTLERENRRLKSELEALKAKLAAVQGEITERELPAR